MDTETVQTVVSLIPMTWRIAVTGGITIGFTAITRAAGAAVGCSTMASYACWSWR